MQDLGATAPATHRLNVGAWDAPLEEVQPGFLSIIDSSDAEDRSATGRQFYRPADRACQLDRQPRESADRARDGEPDLDLSLRSGNRALAERFRRDGRAPVASGIARLAGVGICQQRLGHQEDAQADCDVEHLPAVLRIQ